jgi:thioredoxin-related protein
MRIFLLILGLTLSLYATDWHHSLEKAQAAAADSGKPVLALFMRQGCPHCTRLEQETLSHPVIQKTIAEHYTPLWIDTTKNPQVVRQSGVTIRGVPAAAILEEGKRPRQMIGFRDPMGMMGFLK